MILNDYTSKEKIVYQLLKFLPCKAKEIQESKIKINFSRRKNTLRVEINAMKSREIIEDPNCRTLAKLEGDRMQPFNSRNERGYHSAWVANICALFCPKLLKELKIFHSGMLAV